MNRTIYLFLVFALISLTSCEGTQMKTLALGLKEFTKCCKGLNVSSCYKIKAAEDEVGENNSSTPHPLSIWDTRRRLW